MLLAAVRGIRTIARACNTNGRRTKITLPVEKLTIRSAKSSGPGGQNVNKRMTKVEVRFSIQEADWLTDPVKQALREKFTGKINADGEFIMTSQRHRTREDNQRDALAKLREMIDAAEAVSRGEKTKEEKKQLRIQRNKATRAKRSRQKYGAPAAGEPTKAASLESTPVSHPAL